MKLIKVSILLRDYNVLYSLKKNSGISFWETLQTKLHLIFKDYSVESIGNMQSNFYFCSDSDTNELSQSVSTVITEIVSEKSDSFLVSVKELTTEEINNLSEKNIGDINSREWFAAFYRKNHISKENTGSSAGRNSRSNNRSHETQATVQEQQPETKKQQCENNQKADPQQSLPLSKEIEKILSHKETLLNRVRGQRHAVEEVLNTVFECDAFTSKNTDRTGPLASFLFTGPSGVGKTFLAKQCAQILDRECKILDMSEYSDNLAHGKFNGDYNNRAEVTGFIREHPNGIIVFDEIEKAHINTIHLFLQILDEGHLTDVKLNRKISFKDAIIILTTNAGRSLYEDTSVCNLSNIPRRVILEALRTDVNQQTNEPYFPECIVTRFANGHVVLFNHLEPYALSEIVIDEIKQQVSLFEQSYGITVNYNPTILSALVLYIGGGVSDARTLRGIARQIIVKELQESVTQAFKNVGEKVDLIKQIELSVDIDPDKPEISSLFSNKRDTNVAVFCDHDCAGRLSEVSLEHIQLTVCTDVDTFKKCARGVVDFVLIDPSAGRQTMNCNPHDIEDYKSEGMDVFFYYLSHYPELPIYLLDTNNREIREYDTLLGSGARGVVSTNSIEHFTEDIEKIAFHSHINNAVFSLGRSGKVLTYNSYQYSVDDETAIVMFSRLALEFAKSADDKNILTMHDKENGIRFDDIVGCKSAKEALKEFCGYIANPREYAMKGKHIPKGVLLYGPPGTGKTMLAKAMANEANVAFLPITATSFFGPHVGESENNIRSIFRQARKYAPSIIFIDEVDAIARRRTGSETTSHYENALNAFIAEMEGFSTDEKRPVFIMAATNYEIAGSDGRVLDGAFVRRFDKRIYVDLPDQEARYDFFKKNLSHHSIHFGEDHEGVLKNLAQRTSGLSNADLDKIVNLFLNTVSDEIPSSNVLMDMVDAFRFGEVNKMSEEKLRQTAYHESGHALVSHLLGSTPLFLTVVSRGNFGGYMEHQHDEDALYYSYEQLLNLVCCSLAGRVAEIEIFGEGKGLNTGASSDIDHARRYIKAALDDYAMGENLYSKSDDKVGEKIIQEQYSRTRKLISDHRCTLEKLTELLLNHKSLDQRQLEHFFESEILKG